MFFRSALAIPVSSSAPPAGGDAYLAMLTVLANAIEARNAHASGHTWRVGVLAQATARRLGLGKPDLQAVALGSVLHDIGEIGIPDGILTKPGPLTPEEEEQVMRHPSIGARLLRSVPALEHLVPLVLHHHERYDGTGYPHGLAENAIPFGARLLAAADALDAMTSDRPYRERLGPATAIAELEEGAGGQFDPDVVGALVEAYHAGELDCVLGPAAATGAAVPR
ncbi:MAG TPA: HD domain-containing phosphohydrolase [Thermoanaerobaculales bacterium]|nr:HD domain-containing phosphohydrolase [Thermoanaerobaculales bacterium]HPA80654.1 HD domain-containing phosphohydrolase [Thermoanaerobaculales bacterium]HQL30989.1 HD domain-containing phosphohydrolase [Thermoanaerobaculales bacterium]HQN97014.1 HD domain-containing phosphohydrolase [Thermoanaerobaculales bacterium]HQP43288.1 HD domain-containing phosphohydrolase [Thermoanaerobaculales bacterium]